MDSPPDRHEAPGVSLSAFIYMAQSKSFFGLRRGSTKTLTFSVYNGKQVTKDRVYVVKNPRSSLQMLQRAYMATALHAYSNLKEICDHSFEGLTYGQKSMNYFVSENARMIRSAAPKVNLSLYKGNSVSNAYIIAKGSLPEQTIEVEEVKSVTRFVKAIPYVPGNIDFSFFMNIFGASQIGDMVTFVHLVSNPGGNASMYWLRFKLTAENKQKAINTSSTPVNILTSLTEGADYETNIDNFSASDFPFTLTGETGKSALTIGQSTTVDNRMPQSMGVILSRKSDTGWLRSSSTMVNLTNTYNYEDALATYPDNAEKILNGGNM